MQILVSYSWPGNIRELENLIRYLMVTTEEDSIEPVHLPPHIKNPEAGMEPYGSPPATPAGHGGNLCSMTWPQLEKVTALLKKHNGNITWASKASGINRSTFASRMRKLKIKREQKGFDRRG